MNKISFFSFGTALIFFSVFFLASCSNNKEIIEAYNNGNFEKAESLCRPLAEKDEPNCLYLLGRMAYEGSGRLQNKEEAYKLMGKAAQLNHRNAQFFLGMMLINDEQEIDNISEDALNNIMYAAEGGLPVAQETYYSIISKKKNATEEEKKKAELFLNSAAEKGNASAQVILGSQYCVPVSTVTACQEQGIPLLEKAAADNMFAQRSLGIVYYSRNEFDKSIEPLRKAALQGDGESAFFLGRIYLVGKGYEDGYKWIKAASVAGVKGADEQLKTFSSSGNASLIQEGEKRYAQIRKTIEYNKMILKRRVETRDIEKAFLDKI
ncbi:MAG: sel1 repeat family protein [Elusimicrobiales bacterium]|nr:sel1 repeat family protein [Elusimicrobiales bacterium]